MKATRSAFSRLAALACWAVLLNARAENRPQCHGSSAQGNAEEMIPPLKVGESRRLLVNQRGAPFLYHADGPWMLFSKLTEPEAMAYISRRKQQGFTSVQVHLAGLLGMTHRSGELPFVGIPPEQHFAKPNETFFAHVDRAVTEALQQVMLPAIAPAWSGCRGEDWAGKEKTRHVTW